MDELGNNKLTREPLPGRGAFYEQLMDRREHKYTLEEFGWTTGVCALLQSDNHKLISFLSRLSETTGCEEIRIKKREDDSETPSVFFKGQTYPHTTPSTDLLFMELKGSPSFLVGNSRVESEDTYINPDEYKGTDYHAGWKEASDRLAKRLASGIKIGTIVGERESVRFSGTVNHYHSQRLTLNNILDGTALLLQVIEQSYLITKELPKQREQVVSDYADKMLQAAKSST